jgi:hypothetical protein
MARYRMTAKRRAALRKAQLASARKRRGRKTSRKTKVAVGVLATVGGLAAARHMVTGSRFHSAYSVTDKSGNMSKNRYPEFLGSQPNGDPILRPSKDFRKVEFTRDFYAPGRMRGIVIRSRSRRLSFNYVHVGMRDNLSRARADKRAEKAIFKQTRATQRKVNRIARNY